MKKGGLGLLFLFVSIGIQQILFPFGFESIQFPTPRLPDLIGCFARLDLLAKLIRASQFFEKRIEKLFLVGIGLIHFQNQFQLQLTILTYFRNQWTQIPSIANLALVWRIFYHTFDVLGCCPRCSSLVSRKTNPSEWMWRSPPNGN